MQIKAKMKNQQGFLLLEIVITLLLISVLVAAAGLFTKPTLAGGMAARRTAAANLAQRAVESLKADDIVFWQAVTEKTELDFSGHAHSMDARQTIDDIEYILQGTVEPHSTLSGIVVATITVSYMEHSKLQSLQYETYFTKKAY